MMTDQELNRAVQYVTASTSYGKDTVAVIIKTGLEELVQLAVESKQNFERDALMEYVSQWTIKQTGQPEPLVREVLGFAGRWLDEVYEDVARSQKHSSGAFPDDDDDDDAEPA